MIEVIKQFFGGSISAIEAFVGSVGLMGVISIFASIFYNTYKGKKTQKEINSIKEENKALLDEFIQQHNAELEALKSSLTSDLDSISNMLLLELKKSGFDMATINAVIELYKKVAKNEILDYEKLQEEKEQEIANEQSQQEQVNENLENIDTIINSDLA